jgi:hypothetical protein
MPRQSGMPRFQPKSLLHDLQPPLQPGILRRAVVSVLFNAFVNGGSGAAAKTDAAAVAVSAQHV